MAEQKEQDGPNVRVINLKAADGRTLETLTLYPDLYSVPLNRYVDFLKAVEPLDDREKVEAGEVNEARVLCKAVGAFFGVDLDKVLEAEYGLYYNEDAVTGNVRSLYAWIVSLLGTFKGRIRTDADCKFEHAGSVYTIPVIATQTLAALPLLPDLSTGEMIEALEIKRIASQKIADDPEGSHLYSYYLRLIAVICRKEGERFPIFDHDVTRFIDERVAVFSGKTSGQVISAGIALDIDFFLAAIMRDSKQTRTYIGFLINRAIDLVRLIQPEGARNWKRTTVPSKGRAKSSTKLGGAKPTLRSLRGVGLTKAAKVKSKQ